MNQYLQKSVGEEMERKRNVAHAPTNEIRSRLFILHSPTFDSLLPEESDSLFSAKSRFIQRVYNPLPAVRGDSPDGVVPAVPDLPN